MNAPKILKWELTTWTKEAEDKSIGLPFRCDGCENKIHEAAVYVSEDKMTVRWCQDCINTVLVCMGQDN